MDEVEDVEVHEEEVEVDHPCEVEEVEHEVVDVVDSVIEEVDEVVDEEDSFQEAHQGEVDEVDLATVEADEVVVEEDTRLRIQMYNIARLWLLMRLNALLIADLRHKTNKDTLLQDFSRPTAFRPT